VKKAAEMLRSIQDKKWKNKKKEGLKTGLL
jgi:hypothetical protein